MATEKKCLKCGHVRTARDVAPDYECPRCGAIYKKIQAKAVAEAKAMPVMTLPDTRPAAGGLGKYLLLAAILAGVGYWQFTKSAPPSPPPQVQAPQPPPPPVEKEYTDATEYAQAHVAVVLSDVYGTKMHGKVINRGKQNIGYVTVQVKGFKELLPDPRFAKNKTPDDYQVEMSNGPFPAGTTKHSVLEFPQGVRTLVFPGQSLQAEAMGVPHHAPIVHAVFY